MSKGEKIQLAHGIAATPEERWEMNTNFIKSLGLFGGVRSRRDLEQRKAKLRRMKASSLWNIRLSNKELTCGQMIGSNRK